MSIPDKVLEAIGATVQICILLTAAARLDAPVAVTSRSLKLPAEVTAVEHDEAFDIVPLTRMRRLLRTASSELMTRVVKMCDWNQMDK